MEEESQEEDSTFLRKINNEVINSPESSHSNDIINESRNLSKKFLHNTNVTEILNRSPPNKIVEDSVKNSPKLSHCRSSLFFHDGERSIDFVLVWDDHNGQSSSFNSYERRRIFEENLHKEGLELEYEEAETNGLHFIKIHAPIEVLRRYSEILKLRLPMREDLCYTAKGTKKNPLLHATMYISQKIPVFQEVHNKTNNLFEEINGFWNNIISRIYVDKIVFPPKGHRFTAVYSRDKEYLFDVYSPDFFSPDIHSRIVQFILERKRFSENPKEDFAFGIDRLKEDSVYSAAYPLHDGDLRTPGSLRYILYNEWASVSKSFRYQPLDYIKDYFGVKIALYFAWLGFYTHMLIPAAIVGLCCFIYSCLTLSSHLPSEDICNKTLQIKMCPLCDYFCDYWNLEETCFHARITYLFDNPSTIFFAIFMSFWAAMFLELWKRYSAEITHRWDLSGFDIKEEHPRPEYLARLSHVKKRHINLVTNTMEPHVPFWRIKLPATILSFSIVLLLVAMAVAALLGVVLYRMSVLAALSVQGESVITSYAILFTTGTAASINLCCIMVFNWIYVWLAEYLTELELLRTQTEFDDSLTLKIYLLQFVNYYASIFYIAFFKGKFNGRPGNYYRFFGYRQEECIPGGCLLELCMQLAIIMIGKQAMNTVLEMIFPVFYKWLNNFKVKTGFKKDKKSGKSCYQWLKDFKLVEWGSRGLFPEYLEMVLQYGFVTIFVAAFPLAPFFALLNNILEMRLDAKKLLTYYRRPITQRVRDIGVWFRILDSIGKLSVITNGFIIAFTSNLIPKLVYMFTISPDQTLNGYLNHSLSYFNTKDFEKGSEPKNPLHNITHCRYPDYREPPGESSNYERTSMFWHVMAARLAFVVVFENVVALVMILVRWCIPDMPSKLRDQIRREAYITNEIIIKQEALKAKGLIPSYSREESIEPEIENLARHWARMSGSDIDLAIRRRVENGESSIQDTAV